MSLTPRDAAYYASATYYRTRCRFLGNLELFADPIALPRNTEYAITDPATGLPALSIGTTPTYALGFWRGEIIARVVVPGGSGLVSVERIGYDSLAGWTGPSDEAAAYGGWTEAGILAAATQKPLVGTFSISQAEAPIKQSRAQVLVPAAMTARDSGSIPRENQLGWLATLVQPSAAATVDAWLSALQTARVLAVMDETETLPW